MAERPAVMEGHHPLEPSIVRFLDETETIQGAGFLIADDLVCTCAHVVSAALDLAGDGPPPEHAEVLIDFPFLEAARAAATVMHWTPETEGDVAVLRLTSPRPAGAREVRLLSTVALTGRRVEFLGYPAGNDAGGWSDGRLGRRRSDLSVQLEGERITGYPVQRGFSGTPVWDKSALVVVGMIVAAEHDDRTKVGVMVPVSFIAEVCPAVAVTAARPVQALGEGLAGLPNSPLDGFEHFLREYLGTQELPAPFGGRDAAFRALDDWLADPGSSFALLVAEAGRGKSALLVRWVSDIAQRIGASIVFVPVSIRFGTAAKTVAWSMLGARLRYLHHEVGDPPPDPGAWLGEISIRLRQDRIDHHSLLIVLDGVDEAADWAIGRDLRFPAEVGTGVKIMVSARAVAGRGAAEWADLLDWDNPCRIALPLLSPEGVGQALRSMGVGFTAIAGQAEMVADISRLSEGDPLLVRLWAEKLRDIYETGDFALTAADLAHAEPGFHSFFKNWWEDQQEQWRLQERDAADLQEQVMEFFYLCATALGPVSRQEVSELGAGRWTSPQIGRITQAAERFVIGDGNRQGWVFSHPKLGHYFSDEVMVDEDRREWERRFIHLGARTLQNLIAGQQLRRDGTYGVRHYGAHLERFHAATQHLPGHYNESTCDCAESLHQLVSPVWQRARESVDGSYEGFVVDVDRSWDHAQAEGPVRRALARQVQYALVKASIESLSGHLPPEMITALVRHHVWTVPQALSHIRGLPDDARAAALISLVPIASGLRTEIVSMAQAIETPRSRARALLSLAASSAAADSAALTTELDAALNAMLASDRGPADMSLAGLARGLTPAEERVLDHAVNDPLLRLQLLAHSSPDLSAQAGSGMLNDSLVAVRALDPVTRAEVLARVIHTYERQVPPELLREAQEAIGMLDDPLAKVEGLASIAERLDGPARSELLHEALHHVGDLSPDQLASVPAALLAIAPAGVCEAVSRTIIETTAAIGDPEERARMLGQLATSLPVESRGPAQAAFIAALKQVENATSRSSVVTIWVSPMPVSMARAAAAALRPADPDSDDFESRSSRLATYARAIAEIGTTLPPAEREEFMSEALAMVRTIDEDYWRGIGLADIVTGLPDALVDEAVQLASALESTATRINVLSRLAQYRDEVGASSLAAEVRSVLPEDDAVSALEALIPHLPAEALGETLGALFALDDESANLDTALSVGASRLQVLAAGLPDTGRLEMLRLAAKAATRLRPEYSSRLGVLAELSACSPEPVLRDLLHAMREIRDSRALAWTITCLLPYIPDERRPEAVTLTISLAGADLRSYKSRDIIAGLVPWLSAQQAVKVAGAIAGSDNRDQIPALCQRLLVLGEPDRALDLARSTDPASQLEALILLSGEIPGEMLPGLSEEIMSATRALPPDRRAYVLSDLSRSESGSAQAALVSEAVTAAWSIEEPVERAVALADLLPDMNPQESELVLEELRTSVRQQSSVRDRATVLMHVASGLHEPDRTSLFADALELVSQIRHSMTRAWMLRDIGLVAPEPMLPAVLDLVIEVGDEHGRSTALQGLAPRLPESLVRTAIASAGAYYDDFWRSMAVAPLLSRLGELGHGDEALTQHSLLTSGWDLAMVLGNIAPHLSADSLGRALEIASSLNRFERSTALAGLLCRQSELGEDAAVLPEAAAIPEEKQRATVLSYIATRASQDLQTAMYEPLCRVLRRLARRPRAELLSDISALAPLLAAFGGKDAIADIADLIVEIGKWFP
jgi:hypothetical protein